MKTETLLLAGLAAAGVYLWDREAKKRGSSVVKELQSLLSLGGVDVEEGEGGQEPPPIAGTQTGNTGSLNMGNGTGGGEEPPPVETLPGGISGSGVVGSAKFG